MMPIRRLFCFGLLCLALFGPSAWAASTDGTSGEQHWAFQPVGDPAVPAVNDATWPLTPVDHFILAKLEAQGMRPSPPADRRTWLRRVTFDLIGLPPTAEEVEAFVQDGSPDAFAKVVDRLLSSPHFGERWARHWLDVARYADTKGYVFTEDRNYPQAYTYRDWVIQAFNRDLPYDQFLISQIAADQLPEGTDGNSLAAMGFLTLGRRFLNNIHDITDDRIDVVTRGTMALTVSCARCHDHKYDPIPTADYYSLYGVFRSSEEPKNEPSPLRLVDAATPFHPRIFVRGNPHNHGEEVPRQFLKVIAGENRQPFQQGSGRLELARAIASRHNPLTARVFVNRVWGHLFGTGLVRTPSDFGVRSDPPSHPELLDYLARRFMDEGWSTKKLLRLLVLSRVYQQRSDELPEYRQQDPENLLLWKMNRRRLDFEAQRDALLAVTGELDRTVGGASVDLTEAPFPKRRTVYAFIDRQNLPGVFRTFDFASPDTHAPQRYTTTVPQQALFLMNSPFVLERAEQLIGRPEFAGLADPEARIRQLYRWVLAREPSAEESSLGLAFVRASSGTRGEPTGFAAGWHYGYGEFDEATNRVPDFQLLPHWTGSAWQGGPEMPDPQTGWAALNAQGGHPGNDARHAVIRRWVAPQDGVLTIQGRIKHPNSQGDGVQARIVSDRSGLLGDWTVHQAEADTAVERWEVQAGEAIDFVTSCRTNPGWDLFGWTVSLHLQPAGQPDRTEWNSTTDFSGPRPQPLGLWEQYAQVLLLSNEFVYLD